MVNKKETSIVMFCVFNRINSRKYGNRRTDILDWPSIKTFVNGKASYFKGMEPKKHQ